MKVNVDSFVHRSARTLPYPLVSLSTENTLVLRMRGLWFFVMGANRGYFFTPSTNQEKEARSTFVVESVVGLQESIIVKHRNVST